MPRQPSRALRLLVLAAILAGGGCVEAEDALELASDGSGRWTLDVRWDADLVRRVVDVVGEDVAARVAGRPLPLDVATWQDVLDAADGLAVERLVVEDLEDGRRALGLTVAFTRLEDLLACEVFARRDLEVALVRAEEEATGEGRPSPDRAAPGDTARLRADPLGRVPVLDELAALVHGEEAAVAARLAGWGLAPDRVGLLRRLLAPRMAAARLVARVRVPGRLLEVGAATAEGDREAVRTFDLEALAATRDRALRLTWRPRLLDRVPTLEHVGDARRPGDDPAAETGR